MKRNQKMLTWTTLDEVKFIEKLGFWNPRKGDPKEIKTKFLERYKESMKSRERWGDIEKFEIEFCVEKELAKVQAL